VTLPLSPIDQVFTGAGSYPLEFVFAYAGRIDPDRLADSLKRTLDHFPAVASRLVALPDRGWGLEPSEGGCVFEVVDSPVAFGDPAARYGYISPVESVEGQPLARLRLSRTPDGSVLGVSLSHAVVDGFSFFHFLTSWARVFQGQPLVPPSHRRELLQPSPVPPGPALTPADVQDGCGLFWGEERPAIRRDRLRWHRHLLPRTELSALLARAQAGCGVRLSHNDVIAAWLWQTHVPGWAEGEADATAWINCPVDVRRVLPGLPPTYFGCAVALATASVAREGLREASLTDLALRVRSAVARVDPERVKGSLALIDRLRRQEGLAVLERCHVVHPRAGLLVTNLSRLPVREVEFDAGPPIAFDILTPAERCAVVLPAADGVDVRVCLPRVQGPAG